MIRHRAAPQHGFDEIDRLAENVQQGVRFGKIAMEQFCGKSIVTRSANVAPVYFGSLLTPSGY